MSKCSLIEYPQLFITYNSKITPIKINNKINIDSIIYPNIVKTDKPYLEFDVVANYKKEYIIKELYNNANVKNLYNNTWKLINKNIIKEMKELKELYDKDKFAFKKEENGEEEDNENKIIEENEEKSVKEEKEMDKKKDIIKNKNYEYLANIEGKSNKYLIYEIINKLIEERDKNGIKNEDFKNLDLYKKNKDLFIIAFELSNIINDKTKILFNFFQTNRLSPMIKEMLQFSYDFT
jgi:hypothetical protein